MTDVLPHIHRFPPCCPQLLAFLFPFFMVLAGFSTLFTVSQGVHALCMRAGACACVCWEGRCRLAFPRCSR